jgi:hypothetical protein
MTMSRFLIMRLLGGFIRELRALTLGKYVIAILLWILSCAFRYRVNGELPWTDVLFAVIRAAWIACVLGGYCVIQAAWKIWREDVAGWNDWKPKLFANVPKPPKPSILPFIASTLITVLVLCGVFAITLFVPTKQKARSFAYVAPGSLGFDMGGDGVKLIWDFVIMPVGFEPSYNVEILFVDEARYRAVTTAKRGRSAADVNSYQVLLKYPEIDGHGRGLEFRQPFMWRNAPDPDHQRYRAVITWRDENLLEHLRIDRLTNSGDDRPHTSMDEWVWSMDLQDRETGEILVDCRNKGLGLGFAVKTPKLQSCFQ